MRGADFEHMQLVTIQGPPTGIQMAVSLLYQRLEQEKSKRALLLQVLLFAIVAISFHQLDCSVDYILT